MNAADKRAHIKRLIDGIKTAAEKSRNVEPKDHGGISYPYMYGVLQVELIYLTLAFAGEDAGAQVKAAFQAIEDATNAAAA